MKKYKLFIELENEFGLEWVKTIIVAPNRNIACEYAFELVEYMYDPVVFRVNDYFVGGIE